MGRPLNKKYFGNRNIGTTGTTDDGIGGEGVASAAITVVGSYTTRPTFTFTAPTLPTGVTATGTINSEALSGVATTAGTGYNVGDLLTLTAADGGTATAYVATLVGGAGTGIATVNFTGTGAVRGTFQALPGAKFATGATAPNTVAKTGTGTGAEITVTFRAVTGTSGVTITNKGSGYLAAPTVAGYTNQGGITVATIVLTTDSGNFSSDPLVPGVNAVNNQENAILIYANTTGSSTSLGDIKSQKNSRRYKVTTSDGTAVCNLVANSSPTIGNAYINATDSESNTYWVIKLTNHHATVVPNNGTQFDPAQVTIHGATEYEYQSVPWTFGNPTVNESVKIDNA